MFHVTFFVGDDMNIENIKLKYRDPDHPFISEYNLSSHDDDDLGTALNPLGTQDTCDSNVIIPVCSSLIFTITHPLLLVLRTYLQKFLTTRK